MKPCSSVGVSRGLTMQDVGVWVFQTPLQAVTILHLTLGPLPPLKMPGTLHPTPGQM